MNSTESKFNLKYYAKSVPAHDFAIPVFLTKKDGSKFTDGTDNTQKEEFKIKAWAPKYPDIKFLPSEQAPLSVELISERLGFYVKFAQESAPWKDGEHLTIKLSVDGIELGQELTLIISEKQIKFKLFEIELLGTAPKPFFTFLVADESLNPKWSKKDFYSYHAFESTAAGLLYTEHLELTMVTYNPATGQGYGTIEITRKAPSGKTTVHIANKHIYGSKSKTVIIPHRT